MTLLVLYLTFGVIVSGRTLARGRIGTAGVLPSFIFQTVFWPIFLGQK